MNPEYEELVAFASSLEIVDCHEHLVPEHVRLERKLDVFSLISLYAFMDVVSSGLPRKGHAEGVGNDPFHDTRMSLQERWEAAWPYIERIRFGSYFRPTVIALRDLYDIETLGPDTYEEASRRIAQGNTKGVYRRILRDRCRIKTCLVQNGRISGQDPPELFTPLYANTASVDLDDLGFIEKLGRRQDENIEDLDTYLDLLDRELDEAHRQRAIGFKTAAWALPAPDMKRARPDFRAVLQGAPASLLLKSTVFDRVAHKAQAWGWPIAVHCGIWDDFRQVAPTNFIPTIKRYPELRFDLYHLGMPYARECTFVAKNYPNAFLNLCMTYMASETVTRQTVNEILDTVPVSKVFGFGADYVHAVENVYGQLVMSRETLADALAERIGRGRLDRSDAEYILQRWLHDNPAEFYGVA